jgi:hypothetical protein
MEIPFTPAEHPFGREPELHALGPGSLTEPLRSGEQP